MKLVLVAMCNSLCHWLFSLAVSNITVQHLGVIDLHHVHVSFSFYESPYVFVHLLFWPIIEGFVRTECFLEGC